MTEGGAFAGVPGPGVLDSLEIESDCVADEYRGPACGRTLKEMVKEQWQHLRGMRGWAATASSNGAALVAV